jgi:hypothetical protein
LTTTKVPRAKVPRAKTKTGSRELRVTPEAQALRALRALTLPPASRLKVRVTPPA